MAEHDNDYVLGKGKVYFDRFADGSKTKTGERYFGNTPAFSLSQEEESLDHFNSDEGVRVKDASVTLSQDTSATLECDNISTENLALWWLGDMSKATVIAAEAVVETHSVKRGTYIQLGASDALPQGTGDVDNVTVKIGAATISGTDNWEVDLGTGRLYIEPDAVGIQDDDDLIITYDQGAMTVEMVIAKGKSLYGALRFVSTNPVGTKRDAYFPYVKLAPNGEYDLKGEDWQTLSFALDILKLNSITERVYWTTRPG